jgi:hypothetical protein
MQPFDGRLPPRDSPVGYASVADVLGVLTPGHFRPPRDSPVGYASVANVFVVVVGCRCTLDHYRCAGLHVGIFTADRIMAEALDTVAVCRANSTVAGERLASLDSRATVRGALRAASCLHIFPPARAHVADSQACRRHGTSPGSGVPSSISMASFFWLIRSVVHARVRVRVCSSSYPSQMPATPLVSTCGCMA